LFHEDIRSVHSFSLYINKYIIVLFSGNAEFSGNYSDPDANIVCAKKRKIESEKEREREREGSESEGTFLV